MGNYDFERGERLFNHIVQAIVDAPCPEDKYEPKFWSDGEKILSKDQTAINAIADLVDDIACYGIACTGYYDPEEDRRNDTIDRYTGYYYLEIAS